MPQAYEEVELTLSTLIAPDIVEYLDSGKIGPEESPASGFS